MNQIDHFTHIHIQGEFLIKIRDKKKTQPTRYINLSNAYFSYQILDDYICDFLLTGLTPWLPQALNLINHKSIQRTISY